MSNAQEPTPPSSGRSRSTITLAELDSLFGLSVRARNVCRVNELDTLAALVSANEGGGFQKLRSCGKKTVIELEDLLTKAAGHFRLLPDEATIFDAGTRSIEDRMDRDGMLASIEQRFPSLSARSRNALENLLGEATPEAILDQILLPGYDLLKVRNLGIKSLMELQAFSGAIIGQRTPVGIGGIPEADSTKLFLALKNDLTRQEIHRLRNHVLLDSSGRIRILELIKGVVEVWSERKGSQWRSITLFAERTHHGGEASRAAERLGVSSARIRQLFLKWDTDLEVRLSFIKDIPISFLLEPFTPTGPVVIISRELGEAINAHSGMSWSQPFWARILALVSNGAYEPVSWRELGMGSTSARMLDGDAPLLIRSGSSATVLPVARESYARTNQPRTSETVHELSIIARSLGLSWSGELEEALHPLLRCLEPSVRFDGDRFILPPDRRKRREELVAEVLEELDTPTHVSVVVDRLRMIDPARDWNEGSVRSVVLRFKDRFISFGRTSTYGLRKWEQERPEVRGGTIRSMVEELLRQSGTPLHVDQLADAIRAFRPTTSAGSIKLNLQLASGKPFRFYPGGYVGLADKAYEHLPEPLKRVPGSLMRQVVLRKFIGRPLAQFSEWIASSCEASAEQIERTIQAAITDGRLLVDEAGVIVGVSGTDTSEEDRGTANGELPLPW